MAIKRIAKYGIAIFCILSLFSFLWEQESHISELRKSILIQLQATQNSQQSIGGTFITEFAPRTGRDEKLVTVFTSFLDETNMNFSYYRAFVQSNFLRMTQYRPFQKNVQFLVFTNSKETRQLIARDYPEVLVRDTILRGNLTAPLYKDIVRGAMNSSNSFFYMQVNSCNLYDKSLVLTLESIQEAWRVGLIRQKLLIFGQRYNVDIKDTIITNETTFLELFERAELYRDDTLDYFIMTKDTIDWDTYPDTMMGRGYNDDYLNDYGVHNEVETIDATKSIRLLHQEMENIVKRRMDTYSAEEKANIDLVHLRSDHNSATCARYWTELNKSGNKVTIYDKERDSLSNSSSMSKENNFFTNHKNWVQIVNGDTEVNNNLSSPSVVVVVLSYNKPESLGRLLKSLKHTDYFRHRVDLVISLDVGYLGYYDLPTLIQAKQFRWTHGRKRVVLKQEHRGRLYQWIEASTIVEEEDANTQLLIVEDSVVLNPQWYEYFKAGLSVSEVRSLHKQIAGWSLGAPIGRYSKHFDPSSFFDSNSKESSVIFSGIKTVRNFIPIRAIWNAFLNWFTKHSTQVTNKHLSASIQSKLANLGNHTDWESKTWATWFRYFLKNHIPNNMKILYIYNSEGTLAVRMEKTFVEKPESCYNRKKALVTEFNVEMEEVDANIPIVIPEVIPNYDLDSLL